MEEVADRTFTVFRLEIDAVSRGWADCDAAKGTPPKCTKATTTTSITNRAMGAPSFQSRQTLRLAEPTSLCNFPKIFIDTHPTEITGVNRIEDVHIPIRRPPFN